MKTFTRAALAATFLSASIWAGAVQAQDMSAGKAPGDSAADRSMSSGDAMATRSNAPGQKRSADTTRRAMSDSTARERAFRVIKRSADGGEERMDAAPGVIDAIRGRQKSDVGTPGETSADTAMEGSRAVVGGDGRQRVADTTVYPFDTVGFIQVSHEKSKAAYSCTGALIGPRLVVTAARCIYDHSLEGGWMDNVTFWPGINGADDIPYGSYKWEDIYVLDGYVTEFDGTYDSIWLYDVALIVLDGPAGEKLGWLGYGAVGDGKPFVANLIGYQDDKEDFTQWRSDCDVLAADIRELDFSHDCDAAGWSTGAPLYLFDAGADSRRVVGINMDLLGKKNWAVRFDEPILEWIDSINK